MPSSWSCQSPASISSPGSNTARQPTYEKGVEFPPLLLLCTDIKHPTPLSQLHKAPPADRNNDVEADGYDEKVGGKDKLMVEEMSDDAKQDREEERQSPEYDGVPRLEKDVQRCEVVLEAFFFETSRDFEASFE